MKHTPGVKATIAGLKDWSVFPKRKYGTWHLSIPREDGKAAMRWGIQLAGLGEFPDDEAAAIGERIESCLNACVGIADPAALRREHGELLAALKELRACISETRGVCAYEATRVADELITRLKGGAA